MNKFERTPFESANARDHIPRVLASQFVWTYSFERLMAPKNHIVLGARGSGKTALVKMISHEYLSAFNDPRAKKIIKSRSLIGTYVPMRLDWVGGLKNKPWQSEEEAEQYFQWRLNAVCCAAFIGTIRSCLDTYVKEDLKRIEVEANICKELSGKWLSGPKCLALADLTSALGDEEYKKLQLVQKERITGELTHEEKQVGLSFTLELFTPLKAGINILKKYLEFDDGAVWALCLDEAEYLDQLHHRILNSHLRTYADGLSFKITTKPYKHYTLDTNTNEPLNERDDFEYVYIDQTSIGKVSDSVFKEQLDFAQKIFKKRISRSDYKDTGITIENMLSRSEILSSGEYPEETKRIHQLVLRYGNQETVRRAKELYNEPRYADQIARKLRGAVLLTDKVRGQTGNSQLDAYAGYEMIVKCADGNPRRLLGLLNSLLPESTKDSGFMPIRPQVQNRILRQYSHMELTRVKSEPDNGEQVYRLINAIGQFFKHKLHDEKISTDQYFSIKIDSKDDSTWPLVSEAVGLGLMTPNIGQFNADQLPVKEGVFRISYILAPHFLLLPRKGRSISIKNVVAFANRLGMGRTSTPDQMGLF